MLLPRKSGIKRTVTPSPELLSRVDHLAYAAGELDRDIAEIEQLLGVCCFARCCQGRHSFMGFGRQFLPVYDAALHDEANPLQRSNVAKRVA